MGMSLELESRENREHWRKAILNHKEDAGECETAFCARNFALHGLDVLDAMQNRAELAEAMLRRAVDIMNIHAGRCPLQPFSNFSGMEEHLAEYRQVITGGKDLLKSLQKPAEHAKETEHGQD